MRNVPLAHTESHSLTPRLSLSFSHRLSKYPFTSTRLPPVIRVTALPRPNVCHTHPVYHPVPLPRSRVFRVSLLRSLRLDFRLHPPGPAPSQASGFRPSGLPTPVSPGVPTGARNLGVCVTLFRVSSRNRPLVLCFQTSLIPLIPAPRLSFAPSPPAPSCFSRALPTDSHGSSESAAHQGTSGEGG